MDVFTLRRFSSIPLCLLVIVLVFRLTAPVAARQSASPQAGCLVQIAWKGPGNTHIRYDDSTCDWKGYTLERVELVTGVNNQPYQVLQSGAPRSLTGTFRHANLAKGDRVFYTLRGFDAYDNEVFLAGAQSVIIDNQVGGELLFDETLASSADYPTVQIQTETTVPAGVTLTIGTIQLYAAQSSTSKIPVRVYGGLVFNGAPSQTDLHTVPFYIYKTLSLTDPPAGAALIFMPGSQGSQVTGGKSIYLGANLSGQVTFNNGILNDYLIGPQADVTIANAKNGRLVFACFTNAGVTGQSEVSDSSLRKQVLFSDMEILYLCGSFGSAQYWLAGTGSLKLTRTEIELQNSGGLSLRTEGGASILMDSVVISNTLGIVTPAGAAATAFQAKNSHFLYPVSLSGAGSFDSSMFYGGLSVATPAAVKIQNSIFQKALALPNWTGGSLVLDGNSFTGPSAITYPGPATLSIGSNYYGDREGPGKPDAPFLMGRGALISGSGLKPGVAYSHGSFPANPKVFPSFWLINYIWGQNTIPHTDHGGAYRAIGRDTLLSLDVGVSAASAPGAKIYAEIVGEGTRINPEPYTLGRDGGCTGRSLQMGRCTVDFILPARDANYGVTVYLDTSAMPGPQLGRPPGDKQELLPYLALSFSQQGEVGFDLYPINLGGTCSSKTGSAGAVNRALVQDLPAMLPVPSEKLTVNLQPAYYFKCVFTFLSSTLLTESVASELALASHLRSVLPADYQVAVMPRDGLGGGVYGANHWWSRHTLLVDERFPYSTFHELGHANGLYTDVEQYDLPEFEPLGIPYQNATAFAPEGVIASGGAAGRFVHFPPLHEYGYHVPAFFDLMSLKDPVWPISTTLNSMPLFNIPRPQPNLAEEAGPASGDAVRNLMVFGLLQLHTGAPLGFTLDPGSLRVFDYTGLPISTNPCGTENTSLFSDYFFRVQKLGGGGKSVIWSGTFTPGPMDNQVDDPRLVAPFCVRFQTPVEIDPSVDALELVDGQTGAVLQHIARTALPRLVQAPAAGSSLGASIQLAWSASTATGVLRWVWFSPDGGKRWIPAGLPVDAASLDFSTDFLPPGNDIRIQVVSSDGMQQDIQTISGLKLANRPPVVEITFPPDGTTAPQGTAWSFSGTAFDLEDGAGLSAAWTSSLDGPLGSGRAVTAVLSPGKHTITFQATDSGKLKAGDSIQVTVGPVNGVDLGVAADGLRLYAAGHDPIAGPLIGLIPGVEHAALVEMPGAGVALKVTLALYLKAPGAAEIRLARQVFELQPFEVARLTGSFTPAIPGEYALRVAIESSSLPDPVAANNQRTWKYSLPQPLYLPICRKR